MNENDKIAVVLLNLGGPDKTDDIEPYLKNFFSDPHIITLPKPIRLFLAGRIAKKRANGEALRSYQRLGGGSPLLKNTQAQAQALEKRLHEKKNLKSARVFVSMRYWQPTSDQVISSVKDFAPDKIILLPLYPQYSTATTASSFQNWQDNAQKQGLDVATSGVCCYPLQDGFITASTALIKETYDKAIAENPDQDYRLLFSAHGLPEKTVKAGDPYQWQCESTAKIIAASLKKSGITNLDWEICYQSRVGRLKWIGPSTIEALKKAAADNKSVLIYPHAFVSEHVETLVEIEEDYRKLAMELKISDFRRVPTVSTHDSFIKGLADIVMARLDKTGISSNDDTRLCPLTSSKCCQGA